MLRRPRQQLLLCLPLISAVLAGVQDFYDLSPAKFQNKTNGVTPRRWLAYCNPRLAALITQTLGSAEWIKHADQLQACGPIAHSMLVEWTTADRSGAWQTHDVVLWSLRQSVHHLLDAWGSVS